jgi:hypothetical protein
MAWVLLISLFLQSCNHLSHSPIPIEEQEQGEDSQVLAKQNFLQEEDKGCIVVPDGLASTQEGLREEDEQENEGFQKKSERKTAFSMSYPLGAFNLFPRELLQEMFSYLGPKEIGQLRALNKSFYQLTTGYDQVGLVGVDNQPASDCLKLAANRESLDFKGEIERKFSLETIPSLLFFKLTGRVTSLPSAFWPYLKGTSVHTVDLYNNQIGGSGAAEFAKNLPSTSVHTVYLRYNQIGDSGAAEFAKYLPGTSVHTVDLCENQIGARGAAEFAKNLPGTSVHTVDLSSNQIGGSGAAEFVKSLQGTSVHTVDLCWNQIGASGAAAFAKNLQGTKVHTVNLSYNQIGPRGAAEFAKNLPGTSVHTVNLSYNEIGDSGAVDFAKNLPGTSIHTVHLRGNQMGDETKELLKRQYPQIKWLF